MELKDKRDRSDFEEHRAIALSCLYKKDDRSLEERKEHRFQNLMFALSDDFPEDLKDRFILNSRECDIDWSDAQERLSRLNIFNLEQMSQEFGVKFTHLEETFENSNAALRWLHYGDESKDEELRLFDAMCFQEYEDDFLEPCNRRWSFLGDFNDLAHYFAIRESNQNVCSRRLHDHDYVVTITTEMPVKKALYLRSVVDADEETYLKISQTFIMGYTV